MGAPAEASAAPKKAKGDDWGDMDGFDDAKWESIKANSAKAEAECVTSTLSTLLCTLEPRASCVLRSVFVCVDHCPVW